MIPCKGCKNQPRSSSEPGMDSRLSPIGLYGLRVELRHHGPAKGQACRRHEKRACLQCIFGGIGGRIRWHASLEDVEKCRISRQKSCSFTLVARNRNFAKIAYYRFKETITVYSVDGASGKLAILLAFRQGHTTQVATRDLWRSAAIEARFFRGVLKWARRATCSLPAVI